MAQNDTILHEADVRAVILDTVSTVLPQPTELTVAAPTAAGASYVQATAASSVTAINAIIAALVEAGILVEA